MPEILFKVLSADLNDAREKLKEIMRDRGFALEDRKGPGFDFVGSKSFATYLDMRRSEKHRVAGGS